MSCLPFAPYFLWLFFKAKKQVYRLDDEGTLHFAGDPAMKSGAWRLEQMADIDMNRWMAKSIAYLVHQDGTRLTLDAYQAIGRAGRHRVEHIETVQAADLSRFAQLGVIASMPHTDDLPP